MTESFWGLPSAGWVAIYSIATGIFALLTGSLAIVTYLGIRSQAKFLREATIIQARETSISNNRQQWINLLRDAVAEFLTDIEARRCVLSQGEAATIEAQHRIGIALRRHIYKVTLLIDPTQGESTELLNLMWSALSEGLSTQDHAELVSHTQEILKSEWERVKEGK